MALIINKISRALRPVRLFIMLLALTPDSSPALPDAAQWGGFADGSRLLARSLRPSPAIRDAERRDSLHAWDALSYQVDLRLDLSPAWLEARVEITGVARQELDSLDLHLRGYTLSETWVDGLERTVARQDDQLDIDLTEHPVAAGDTFHATLEYSGTPVAQAGVGLFVSPSLAYTLSDPWGTRNWIACFDEPFDKALWNVSVRADSTLSTLSNGDLIGIQPHGDGTSTWSYRHPIPMSSYLVSIVTGHLSVLEDEWQGLPLRWFVYPQHVNQAWQAVSRMDQMLDCFSGLWGSYPFASYAMGEAPIYGGLGAMEHQTCTTVGNGIIGGGLQYEAVIAHELSHMWWGDAVTPVDFRHVWLNEGWATYGEAYYYQHLAGGDEAAFLDYLRQIHQTYLNWDSQFLPIYDPPADDLFNISQYEKAASVIHMLRDLMGNEVFSQAQRDWQAAHRYGTVDSQDYQAAMEAACGLDLDWFFQQWIYSGGYPTYQTVTEQRQEPALCRVHLTVNQSHQVLADFRARLPVRIATDQLQLDTLLWIEEPSQQFSWNLPGQFDTLIFNAGETVLCRHQVVPPVATAPQWRLRSFAIDDTVGGNGDGDLAMGESGWLSLELENIGGWDMGIQFSLESDDLEVEGAWETIPEVGGGTIIHLPGGRVRLAGWQEAGLGFAALELHSNSDSFEEQVASLRLPMGDPWLQLVARSNQLDLLPFYQSELDSLTIFADLLQADLEPLPTELQPEHRALLWLTGDSGQSLMASELEWLGDCFDNQRVALLVTGQDAIDPLQDAWGAISIRALSLDLPEVRVDGVAGELEGLTALLIGAGGAMNQLTPSSLQGDGCQVLARYHNSGEAAILRQEGAAGSRIIVVGFGLEAISGMAGTSSRRAWLESLTGLLDLDAALWPPREPTATTPRRLELGAPQPNPFNPVARLPYRLGAAEQVQMSVHDLRGRLVRQLELGRQVAGDHWAVLDGSGLASGLYLVTLEAGGVRETGKALLLK